MGGNRRRSPLANMCATPLKPVHLHLLNHQRCLSLMSTVLLSRDKTVPVLSGKLNTSKYVKSLAKSAYKGKRKSFRITSIKQVPSGARNPEEIHTLPALPSCQEWQLWSLPSPGSCFDNNSVFTGSPEKLRAKANHQAKSRQLSAYLPASSQALWEINEAEGKSLPTRKARGKWRERDDKPSTFSLPVFLTEPAIHAVLFPQTPFLISVTSSLI